MPQELSHDLTTPGEALKATGYVTGYFGKWHLGRGAEFAPDTHGYEHTEQIIKWIGNRRKSSCRFGALLKMPQTLLLV